MGKFGMTDEELANMLRGSDYTEEEIESILSGDSKDAGERELSYRTSVRSMFYPSAFDSDVKTAVWLRDNTAGARCPICGQPLSAGTGELSIDHIIPVARHFNQGGYHMTQRERKEWYNDINNLTLVHASCNSSKSSGGERYRPNLVKRALQCYRAG